MKNSISKRIRNIFPKADWARADWLKFIGKLLVVFVIMKLFAMHGWYGAYKGVVVDSETGEPIEGAVVVAAYHRDGLGVAGSYRGSPVEVKETVTDKNGEFFLWPENVITWPYPQLIFLSIGVFQSDPDIGILKSGYRFLSYKQFHGQDKIKPWEKMQFVTVKETWFGMGQSNKSVNIKHSGFRDAESNLASFSRSFNDSNWRSMPLFKEAYDNEYEFILNIINRR